MSAVLELEWTTPEQGSHSMREEFIPHVKAELEHGYQVAITVRRRKDTKSRQQEKKLHAMYHDIADQLDLFGKKLPAESWKRILIDAFKHDTKNDPDFRDEWARFGDIELVPALNHPGFVMVGEQSRSFGRKLTSALIEWLLAFGAERGVIWKDPKFLAWLASVEGSKA